MKKLKVLLVFFLVFSCFSAFIKQGTEKFKIAYPTGYRNWVHVKSNIVGASSPAAPKYEGFTHIYANSVAMIGYKTGNFPNGSIIVFDVIESRTGKNGISEGSRKFIDVMVKDTALYAQSGGWGFEEFDKDTKDAGILKEEQKATCFKCHDSQKEKGYVFSTFRE